MKKLLASFLIGITLLFSLAPLTRIKAAGTWYNQSFQEWSSKVYDDSNPNEIFGERYTAAQVQWIMYGLFSFIMNPFFESQSNSVFTCLNSGDIGSCVGDLAKEDALTYFGGSIQNTHHGSVGSVWASIFSDNRPISGISYVKNKLHKFNPAPSVKAQENVGIGYEALGSVQSFWVAVRDIAFGLFILAVIVLAFMIMFRVKISPQVVITIQSAIPKVIVSLVLVTFSYAIAGFLIDLMYLILGIVSMLFLPIVQSLPQMAPNSVDSSYIFNWLINGPSNTGIFGLVWMFLKQFTKYFALAIAANVNLLVVGAALGVIIYILLIIISFIVAIITAIKIFWSLAKALAQVLLLTIAAPLQITAGVFIPNFGFGSWLKSFSGSLSTFVVTGVLFLLSYIFLFEGVTTAFPDTLTSILTILFGSKAAGAATGVTTTTTLSMPLLGLGETSVGVGLLFMVVSFVIFTLIPKASQIVQGFITGKPFAYGTAIGEALGPAKGLWERTGGTYVSGIQRGLGERAWENFQSGKIYKFFNDPRRKNPTTTN